MDSITTDAGQSRAVDGHVMGLRIEEVHDLEGLMRLEPTWNRLLGKSGRPTLFLTFEWLTIWWTCHARDGMELYVLVVRDAQEILGLAPLMRVRRRYFGVPLRTIEFLSMAEHADHPMACAGDLDFIVAKQHRAVVGALLSHLLLQHQHWDFLRLHPLPEDSPVLEMLQQVAGERGSGVHRYRVIANACVEVKKDWESYFADLSGKFKRELRRTEKELGALGNVTWKEVRSLDDGRSLYDEVMAIERQSWKWDKGVSLNSVVYRGFYSAITEMAARKGWLRLWKLSVGSREIAYELCIEFDGHVQCLKKSYAADVQRYSPGTILEWKMYQDFFRKGIKSINNLWGDEAHKEKWAPRWVPHDELFVFKKSLSGRALQFVFFTISLYRLRRIFSDIMKRLMRKVGVRASWSEYTRADQLTGRAPKGAVTNQR